MADDEIVLGDKKREGREQKEVNKIKDFIEESEVKSEFYLVMNVTLQSTTAKRLYKRVFDHMQTQATAATLLTRKFGLRELSDANVEKIDSAFSQLSTEMTNDLAYADKILEDIGIQSVETEDAVEVIVKVTCPQGMALLNLIRQLDMLSIKLKTLWMSGELKLAKTEDRAHAWQRRIFKSCDAVRALGQAAYIAADKKKTDDAAKLEKQRTRQQDKRQSNNKPNKTAATKIEPVEA